MSMCKAFATLTRHTLTQLKPYTEGRCETLNQSISLSQNYEFFLRVFVPPTYLKALGLDPRFTTV